MLMGILATLLVGMQVLSHDIRHEVRLSGSYLTVSDQGVSFDVARSFRLDPLGTASSSLSATLSDVSLDWGNVQASPYGGSATSSLVSNLGKTWDVSFQASSSKEINRFFSQVFATGTYSGTIDLSFYVDEPTPFRFRHQTSGASWISLASTTATIYETIDPIRAAGDVAFLLQPDVYSFHYRSNTQFFSSYPYADGSSSFIEFHTVPETSVLILCALGVFGAFGVWRIRRRFGEGVAGRRLPRRA